MELGNMLFGHSNGNHQIPRNQGFENYFTRLFEHLPDASHYGTHFKNEVFETHPYCWCEEDTCPQCGTGEQVNFHHFQSGLKITWYKYPLRDAYSNIKFDHKKLSEIIEDCISSIQK